MNAISVTMTTRSVNDLDLLTVFIIISPIGQNSPLTNHKCKSKCANIKDKQATIQSLNDFIKKNYLIPNLYRVGLQTENWCGKKNYERRWHVPKHNQSRRVNFCRVSCVVNCILIDVFCLIASCKHYLMSVFLPFTIRISLSKWIDKKKTCKQNIK